MAYMRPTTVRCYDGNCPKNATVEVLNERNESIGQFCQRHGEAMVKRLNEG